MNHNLVLSLVRSFVAALLMAILLSMTGRLDYLQRVAFCSIVGLFVGVAMDAQQFIWFEAPLRYTLVNTLDHVAEWFSAGLAIAGIVKGRDNL
jgi:hydrogenase/urease accessory protein HupE